MRTHPQKLRWGALVALVAAAITAAGAPAGAVGQTPGLRVVRDPANRFTIDVPATWHVQTSVKNPSVVAKAPAPPRELPDSVDVIVYDMATPISPATCVHEAEQVMRFAIRSWTNVSEGPATVAGLPAYTRTYTWRASTGDQRRSVQTCVTQGRRAFMMIGTTENTPAQVRADVPVLLRVLETLRVNPGALPSPTPTAAPSGPHEH